MINGLVVSTSNELSTLNPYDPAHFQQPSSDEIEQLLATPLNLTLAIIFVVSLFASLPYVIALQVRRLHDLNHSGWFLILGFIPVVTYIYSLYISLWPGSEGENKYGSKPLHKLELKHEVFNLK